MSENMQIQQTAGEGGSWFWASLKYAWRFLFFPVFSPRRYRRQNPLEPSQDGQTQEPVRQGWFARHQALCLNTVFGLAMRLLSTPLVMLISIALVVYASVHSDPKPVTTLPNVLGLYSDNVEFKSLDGTVLQGWYIPSLEASDVLTEGDKALCKKKPGVVLCHDLGANRSQLLGMAAYLHYKGYEILAFDFRCSGDSDGTAQTFGLQERQDVLAAVHYLQMKPRVQSDQIAVVGQGAGAIAALSAAGLDNSIDAVVIADIDRNLQTAVERKLGETFLPTQLCSAAFSWGCKTYFHVNESELSAVHQASLLSKDQSVLLIYRPRNEYFAQSASEIIAAGNGKIKTLAVDTINPCILTDVPDILPSVADFLNRTFGDANP